MPTMMSLDDTPPSASVDLMAKVDGFINERFESFYLNLLESRLKSLKTANGTY